MERGVWEGVDRGVVEGRGGGKSGCVGGVIEGRCGEKCVLWNVEKGESNRAGKMKVKGLVAILPTSLCFYLMPCPTASYHQQLPYAKHMEQPGGVFISGQGRVVVVQE